MSKQPLPPEARLAMFGMLILAGISLIFWSNLDSITEWILVNTGLCKEVLGTYCVR